jgi:hypothetical protein
MLLRARGFSIAIIKDSTYFDETMAIRQDLRNSALLK